MERKKSEVIRPFQMLKTASAKEQQPNAKCTIETRKKCLSEERIALGEWMRLARYDDCDNEIVLNVS